VSLASLDMERVPFYLELTWFSLSDFFFFLWAEGAVFDASQYAFFGKDHVEEVELGGLEDGEELPAADFEEEEFLFDRQEVPSSLHLEIFYPFYLIL